MKLVFILSLFVSVSVVGQSTNCDSLIEVKEDKFNKSITIQPLEPLDFADEKKTEGFIVQPTIKSGKMVLFIGIYDNKCIDKLAKLEVLLENGEVLNTVMDNDFTCDHLTYLVYGKNSARKKIFDGMRAHKVKSMRLHTHSGYVERDFPAEGAEELRNIFSCIYNKFENLK